MSKTFTSAASLICVVVLGTTLAGCLSPSEHYRRYQDGRSLRAVLRNVQNGDRNISITQLLGTKTYKSDTHLKGIHGKARLHPNFFPSGLKKSDVIILYPYDERGLVELIFRDGQLINHDPKRYPKVY